MNEDVEKRIADIHGIIEREREALADLFHKSSALKPQLRDITAMINLVEGGCLDPEILAEPRTAAQWKYWLDSAMALLDPAIKQREYLAELFVKFGPDIKFIP